MTVDPSPCPCSLMEALPAHIPRSKHSYRVGQIVSDCPNGTPCVGAIVSGRIDVYSVALDGRDVQLNSLGAGDCFGICNLLSCAQMQTVLRCGVDTEILYVPKAELVLAMDREPALALSYAALCNEKLQFLIERIELLTMQSCRGKVLAYLLSKRNEENCIFLQGSREELASRLGMSRAALFRELSTLQNSGLIKAEGNAITLCNPARLEELLYHTPQTR